MNRYGTLIAAAVALGLAAWDLIKNDGSEAASQFAAVSMTVGLILVGAWLAIEIYHLWDSGQGNRPPEESTPEDGEGDY